jgi:Ca-activated chloride channel family protein
MTFLAPSRLWLLVAGLALIAGYVVLQRRARHKAVRHPDVALVAAASSRYAGWRRHLTAAAVLVSVLALVLGLARPARSMEVPRDEAVIVLAVDISASMGATDVAPSRLEAAIAAGKEFVAGAPDAFKIGLVTFDTTGHTVTTPTTDHTEVETALDGLKINTGTATGEGLATALDVVQAATADSTTPSAGGEPYSAVVLLADGASTVGRPLDQAATAAADDGVPVFTIAYGTDAGTVDIKGQQVAVPVDEASLAKVADTTGGTAYTARTADELSAIYDRIGVRVGTTTDQVELTLPLAALAAALLGGALIGSALWSPRLV